MGVHDQHVGRIDKDCGIAIPHRLRTGKREVNAVGNVLDFEQVSWGAGSCSLRPSCTARSQTENRRSGQARDHVPKKIAARNSVTAHNISSRISRDSIIPVSEQSTPGCEPYDYCTRRADPRALNGMAPITTLKRPRIYPIQLFL